MFVGSSKLLSNVKNVMCVPKWDMTIPEKAIFQKERKKKSCFTSSSTILMKIFKKIRDSDFRIKILGWTQGGGKQRLCHPPKVFFPLRSSCFCSCSCSESKCSIKKSSRNSRVLPNLPSLQISNKKFFFFTFLIFFSFLT